MTAPLAISFFYLAWLLQRKITCWRFPILLAPFASFSYLLTSLIGDNIQYLSFRAFQQMRFLVVRSGAEAVSIVLALTILFVVVVASCVLYLLIWRYDRGRLQLESLRSIQNSFILANFTLLARALAGFLHAYVDS